MVEISPDREKCAKKAQGIASMYTLYVIRNVSALNISEISRGGI